MDGEDFETGYINIDPSSSDAGTILNNAQAYALPSSVDGSNGIPQAPWYQGLLDVGANLASQYAQVQIAGDARRQGIAYAGSTPWVSSSGAVPIVSSGSANIGLILLVVAGVVLLARE